MIKAKSGRNCLCCCWQNDCQNRPIRYLGALKAAESADSPGTGRPHCVLSLHGFQNHHCIALLNKIPILGKNLQGKAEHVISSRGLLLLSPAWVSCSHLPSSRMMAQACMQAACLRDASWHGRHNLSGKVCCNACPGPHSRNVPSKLKGLTGQPHSQDLQAGTAGAS